MSAPPPASLEACADPDNACFPCGGLDYSLRVWDKAARSCSTLVDRRPNACGSQQHPRPADTRLFSALVLGPGKAAERGQARPALKCLSGPESLMDIKGLDTGKSQLLDTATARRAVDKGAAVRLTSSRANSQTCRCSKVVNPDRVRLEDVTPRPSSPGEGSGESLTGCLMTPKDYLVTGSALCICPS